MENASRDLIRLIGQMINLPIATSISTLEFALAALKEVQEFLTQPSHSSQVDPVPAGGAQANGPTAATNPVSDTFNGLAAFVVPGSDVYSSAQGATAQEPGAVSVHVTEMMIGVLDRAIPSPPQGPASSAAIAGLLNQVAQRINPSATGSFQSSFARLSFSDKVRVFQFIEGDPSMAPFKRVGGILAFFVAFLFYSEASTFDFATRTLKGRPAGWIASKYGGVSDGSGEFRGYYQNRTKVETGSERQASWERERECVM